MLTMPCKAPVGAPSGGSLNFSHVLHYDMKNGSARKSWTPGAQYQLGEAVFAPRTGATQEGDGYLMVWVLDGASGTTEIVVLDARDVKAGPIARMPLDVALPAASHVGFFPEIALG